MENHLNPILKIKNNTKTTMKTTAKQK